MQKLKRGWLLSLFVVLLLSAISLSCVSCAQSEEGATVNGRNTDMHDSIEEYLDQAISTSEFAIYYHIGDSFSGETDLLLKGDGQYELWSTVTQGRQRKEYTGQLVPERVREIAKTMQTVQLWEVKHVRAKPGEDDPDAIIGVQTGTARSEVVLWVSEISQSPAFSEVQDRLLSLIHDVSDGEVLESGR
jgi:hypothetical protein